jgi:hypothetical protein
MLKPKERKCMEPKFWYFYGLVFYLQMESPILIDNGYIEANEGSMRESYSVHCDESFTPSPGKPFIAGSSADFKRNGQDLVEYG